MKNLVKRIKDMPLPQHIIDKILNNIEDAGCGGLVASARELRYISPDTNKLNFMLGKKDSKILLGAFKWKDSREGRDFWATTCNLLQEQEVTLNEAKSILNGS